MQKVEKADVVVIPSLWEDLSVFMLKMLSCGKVIMLSDIPSFLNAVEEIQLGDGEI